MPSREQIYAMLKFSKRDNNFFSTLPLELIQEIATFDEGPNSDIGKALKYAAYARQEDVEALLKMLDDNPSLLLETGHVITPGGDDIRRVTIYEFALGAGDYELAKMVQPYFSKIKTKDAEQQRIRQYERYKPHINGMLEQKPYDLEPLIDLIKKASAEDVTALLNKDMTRKSELCAAMVKFRKDWAPRILTKPCMHYNYASLQHAFEILDRECKDRNKTGGGNDGYDKIRLVWRQLIGFEMRRLPGIDRCVMAQGLYHVIGKGEKIRRSDKFREDDGVFSIIATDDSLDGLGGDFAVNIVGATYDSPKPWRVSVRSLKLGAVDFWKTYVEQKLQTSRTYADRATVSADCVKLMSNKNVKLAELIQSQPVHQPTGCLIL